MNKRVLLLAGAISALFAGQQATTNAPKAVTTVDIESLGASVTIGADFAIGHEQTPAKPAAEHKVVAQSSQMFPGIGRHIIKRPGRRKVKYGRHRWVIV